MSPTSRPPVKLIYQYETVVGTLRDVLVRMTEGEAVVNERVEDILAMFESALLSETDRGCRWWLASRAEKIR